MKIPFYLRWWFFLPISFFIVIMGGGYLFSFFFPYATDYNVAKTMLFVWILIVTYWISYKKKYKTAKELKT